MLPAFNIAQFAERNKWIVIDQDKDYIRYLTPTGQKVLVEFNEDGSVYRIYP